MPTESLGVAVIGAGMAGRSHAAGYRSATTTYGPGLPDVRLVAIGDVNEQFAADTARRFGYARTAASWQEVAGADDVDVVSVVVANHLHREVVEGLLEAGKHVLCEKPFAPTVDEAESMVAAARRRPDLVTGVGFTFRRSPAIAAVKQLVDDGAAGRPIHFNGHYWCDYGADPAGPMSWRYKGGPGSGALADIGSHLVDLAEFLCGPLQSVRGTTFSTVVTERALPLGAAVGHAAAALGVANSLGFELFGEHGAATFDLLRAGEFGWVDRTVSGPTQGYRTVALGPAHPYLTGGLPMDFPGVGYGQNDLFVFQARAFLEQVAGLDQLPPVPSFEHGLHNLRLLAAITESAAQGGAEVKISSPVPSA